MIMASRAIYSLWMTLYSSDVMYDNEALKCVLSAQQKLQ